MSFPCNNPCIQCEPSIGGGIGPVDPANPFINLSSETPDVDTFIGRRYWPPGDQPPLGDTFYAAGCLGWCFSTVSQQAADICAANQAVLCIGTNWPQTPLNPPLPPPFNPPPPQPPVPPTPRPLFYNTEQSCDFNCPDGSIFTFTVPFGTFISIYNQATVDELARTYACNQAIIQRLCLSTLTPAITCSESLYEGVVIGSSVNAPITYTLSAPLPPGLVMAQNELAAFFTGTPTTPGDYVIALVATDTMGNTVQKNLDLLVFGFTNPSTLPEVELDTPYSVTLETAGSVEGAVEFSVVVGMLPAGLTLNSSTGVISGTTTETEDGNFFVTVEASAQDSGISCSKEFLIAVDAGCGSADNVQFSGLSGVIATGFDVTLPEAEFDTNGYTINIVPDGTPMIAVIQAHWGEAQLANWLISWESDTQPIDFLAFGNGSTAFDNSIDKTLRIPVYPYGTISGNLFTVGTAADMGDCEVTTTLECLGVSDLGSIAWGAPTINTSGSGAASASGVGPTFTAEISNDATGGEADVTIAGTFVATGNGAAGKLILNVSNLVSRGTGGTFFPRFVISADSNLDGTGIWFCDSTNGDWLETDGEGVYEVPFVIGYTPGAVITITVEVVNIDTTEAQSITISGVFAQW